MYVTNILIFEIEDVPLFFIAVQTVFIQSCQYVAETRPGPSHSLL